jgi:hypothetical protein
MTLEIAGRVLRTDVSAPVRGSRRERHPRVAPGAPRGFDDPSVSLTVRPAFLIRELIR